MIFFKLKLVLIDAIFLFFFLFFITHITAENLAFAKGGFLKDKLKARQSRAKLVLTIITIIRANRAVEPFKCFDVFRGVVVGVAKANLIIILQYKAENSGI